MLEAWDEYNVRRAWLVDDFCKPIYKLFLCEAVARGRLQAPGFWDDPVIQEAWCNASWVGPVAISIDPVKETKAALMQAKAGIKTYSMVTQQLGGGDFEANTRQLQKELEMMQDAGIVPTELPDDEEEGGISNESD